jgi:hypothetical protein
VNVDGPAIRSRLVCIDSNHAQLTRLCAGLEHLRLWSYLKVRLRSGASSWVVSNVQVTDVSGPEWSDVERQRFIKTLRVAGSPPMHDLKRLLVSRTDAPARVR